MWSVTGPLNVEGVAMKIKLLGLLVGLSIASVATPAAALLITATGSGSDGPLSASADFTFNTGSVTVTLSNLLSAATIRSAGQTVSDLSFRLSNPAGTLGTPTASGQLANIGSGGSVTNVSGSPSRWLANGHISVTGNTVSLEAIGGGQPDQLILPSGKLPECQCFDHRRAVQSVRDRVRDLRASALGGHRHDHGHGRNLLLRDRA